MAYVGLIADKKQAREQLLKNGSLPKDYSDMQVKVIKKSEYASLKRQKNLLRCSAIFNVLLVITIVYFNIL